MQYTRFSVSLCAVAVTALLSTSLAGWAQSSDTTEEAAETETQETPNIQNELSLGEEALGETYVKEEIGDWQLQCLRTENPENDPCQMYQLLKDEEGTPVSEVSLFRLPGDGQAKAGATVIVPLETQLQNQLTIQVDSNKAKRYPFMFCNQVGCYSRIGLTAEDVASFKRGNAATVTIVPALAPDKKINLKLSLTGFTKSYDQVSVIQQ